MDRRVLQADVSEGGIGLAHLYPAREESICLLLATMDIRAHPISFSARSWKRRPDGSPDHGCDGETVPPSPQSNSHGS